MKNTWAKEIRTELKNVKQVMALRGLADYIINTFHQSEQNEIIKNLQDPTKQTRIEISVINKLKENNMDESILVLGIENEFEGDQTMYFDMSDPMVLINYLKDNIDLNVKREFILKPMLRSEFESLL